MTKEKGSHNDKNNRMGQNNTNTNKGADNDDDSDQGMKTNNKEDSVNCLPGGRGCEDRDNH